MLPTARPAALSPQARPAVQRDRGEPAAYLPALTG
jgi:hypothetical protein